MPGNLIITDERMLEAPYILKKDGRVRFVQECWDTIGFSRENLPNVKRGHQRFTLEHIQKLCYRYGINVNWVFGLEPNFYRLPPIVSIGATVKEKVKETPEKPDNLKKNQNRNSMLAQVSEIV